MSCPDPSVWIRWLDASQEREPGAAEHLAGCASCRGELAVLLRARPEGVPPGVMRHWASGGRGRRLLPYAAAAALMLAVFAWRRAEEAPSPTPAPPQAPPAPALAEMPFGRTGTVVGARGRFEGGAFVLEEGEAWVESEGDPVRIRVDAWLFELAEGAASFRAKKALASLWMREAWGAEAPPVRVARGRVRVLEGTGAGSDLLPGGTEASDPRRWTELLEGPVLLRDSVKGIPLPARGTLELLLRKREISAEGALIFRSGERTWEAPLGVHLPSRGWVRLRLDLAPERARLRSGDREYFSCPPARLGTRIQPAPEGLGTGLRAWGGSLEIREARWRP